MNNKLFMFVLPKLSWNSCLSCDLPDPKKLTETVTVVLKQNHPNSECYQTHLLTDLELYFVDTYNKI